jgi:hypothetical protein
MLQFDVARLAALRNEGHPPQAIYPKHSWPSMVDNVIKKMRAEIRYM